jgi:predicted nucleotidyltransferase
MDVVETLRKHRGELDAFSVRRIGVFGSFARGEGEESSDVDVLVEFEEPTFDNFMDLAFYLEELLGRSVDLVTNNALSPYIAPTVRKEVVWCE